MRMLIPDWKIHTKPVLGVLAAGLACGVAMLGQDALPVRPRVEVSEYEIQASTHRVQFGAALLSRSEASRFFTPLEDQYYVVEIAVYPVQGQPVELERDSFRLGTDGKSRKPQNPHAIATFLFKTAPPAPGMETTSRRSESIGIRRETGRPTEVFTEQRRGVGISSGHYWTHEDRERMYSELSSLELPEGSTAEPVAGYLYFSIKSKRPAETVELLYRDAGENVTLRLR